MLLNMEQLSEVQRALNENFPTLLDLFFTNSKIQIDQICIWKTASENQSVMIAAHTLKSSAANLGLNQLASQCSLIETACDENQNHNISELIAKLDPIYKDSISALKKSTAAITT